MRSTACARWRQCWAPFLRKGWQSIADRLGRKRERFEYSSNCASRVGGGQQSIAGRLRCKRERFENRDSRRSQPATCFKDRKQCAGTAGQASRDQDDHYGFSTGEVSRAWREHSSGSGGAESSRRARRVNRRTIFFVRVADLLGRGELGRVRWGTSPDRAGRDRTRGLAALNDHQQRVAAVDEGDISDRRRRVNRADEEFISAARNSRRRRQIA